jgi:Putative MetA-pathway of phenol degradation
LADGFFGFKIGLIGAPALNVSEFAKHKPAFSMMGYFRVWYSGSYDQKNIANMGTNRATYEFGFPMALPLNNNPKRATWWEIYPALQIFSKNTEPSVITRANESHGHPLFILENHLTHNFTDKFWAGVDLRFQYGGALELDDVKQDNNVNVLGVGVSAGYQILSMLGASASYGGILAGDNDARSNMVRLSLIFVYVNMKKLKQPAK